jgi:hypothetical protein
MSSNKLLHELEVISFKQLSRQPCMSRRALGRAWRHFRARVGLFVSWNWTFIAHYLAVNAAVKMRPLARLDVPFSRDIPFLSRPRTRYKISDITEESDLIDNINTSISPFVMTQASYSHRL